MLMKPLATVGILVLLALATLSLGGASAHADGRASPRYQSADRLVAQACLTRQQIRAAVQSGQAIPLSELIATIQATVAGQVLPQPQLCRSGSGLVYLVNILTGNGQVQQLTIDAGSGTILGY